MCWTLVVIHDGRERVADSHSTLSWSASFYPQPIHNWRRESTQGLAIDFPVINMLGFVCYTISTSTFLYSPRIRAEYAARHPASPIPAVRLNDLAFAVHGVVLTVLTYSQFFPSLWGFKVGTYQRVSKTMAGIFWGGLLSVLVVILVVVGCQDGYLGLGWEWIDGVGGHGS